jgi:hypothetical protein
MIVSNIKGFNSVLWFVFFLLRIIDNIFIIVFIGSSELCKNVLKKLKALFSTIFLLSVLSSSPQ